VVLFCGTVEGYFTRRPLVSSTSVDTSRNLKDGPIKGCLILTFESIDPVRIRSKLSLARFVTVSQELALIRNGGSFETSC